MLMAMVSLARAQDTPSPSRTIQRELLQVATRKGVTQPCLWMAESPTPKAIAILFPGGNGAIGLGRKPLEAVLRPQGNFLIRSADQLLTSDLAVLIIDCPSDWNTGMEDAFRASDDHASDVKAVIASLRHRFKDVKVFLVGTSRGTVSAAYAAEALGADIDGLVLTSSAFNANKKNIGLSLFHFERLKVPLLLVHHAEDGCPVCPYSQAVRLAGKAALITVRGSIEPESGPCDPLSNHGYFGREAQVMKAIRGWILGQPFDRDIP
jgi:pimeloyl-ACP methyl ester carboxylesterase